MFTFVVLILNTNNFYLSVIASVSILSIILMLISMIPFAGWQFGLIESTSVIIFVGISFDYVVHICHQYNHSMSMLRQNRMDDAYT